jgi:hypothetical protein
MRLGKRAAEESAPPFRKAAEDGSREMRPVLAENDGTETSRLLDAPLPCQRSYEPEDSENRCRHVSIICQAKAASCQPSTSVCFGSSSLYVSKNVSISFSQ